VTLLIITVIVCALVFTYINGFHDTANSIATVIATKVLIAAPGRGAGGGHQSVRRLHGQCRCQHDCFRPR
jgi:hypothetical protein